MFLPRFKHSFTDFFAIHFKTILIWFVYILASCLQVVSCLSCIGEDSSLADGLVKMSEQGRAYLRRFGVPCFAIRNTNHCYQSIARISIILYAQNCPVLLWKGDCHSQKYIRDHWLCRGKPFDFTQSFYTAL